MLVTKNKIVHNNKHVAICKHIQYIEFGGLKGYMVRVWTNGYKCQILCDTLEEAKLRCDMILIKNKRQPIYRLKKI